MFMMMFFLNISELIIWWCFGTTCTQTKQKAYMFIYTCINSFVQHDTYISHNLILTGNSVELNLTLRNVFTCSTLSVSQLNSWTYVLFIVDLICLLLLIPFAMLRVKHIYKCFVRLILIQRKGSMYRIQKITPCNN